MSPAEALDLTKLVPTFTLRTSDGFVENFGPHLMARVAQDAPGVRFRFVSKPDKESGHSAMPVWTWKPVSWETPTGLELRTQVLFRDHFVGVVGTGHPLSRGKVTPARYASANHITVSRCGLERGPIDNAMKPLGMERQIVTVVAGFSAALAFARGSDLVASVPDRQTGNLRAGMH